MAKTAKKSAKASKAEVKRVASNKKAKFEFEILERFEAGLVLRGTEVKAMRDGGVSIEEGFVRFRGGEAFLIECTIPEFRQGNVFNHAPKRPRKLLLHKREIARIKERAAIKGLTTIPLQVYFNEMGLAKCEIGLVRPRQRRDKRQQERSREAKREIRDAGSR